MEWLHSLQGRLGDNTPQFLNPQTCYCPDHATISTMPICGIHFCRIVVTILIQIVESEIRKRNLKTSFELSLLLNQFACEELTKLNLQETVDRMPRSPVQELRMLLVRKNAISVDFRSIFCFSGYSFSNLVIRGSILWRPFKIPSTYQSFTSELKLSYGSYDEWKCQHSG